MTRNEKWGNAWRALEKVYIAVRGDIGERKILNEQRNFSFFPAKVFYSLYQSIQPECIVKGVSLDDVNTAIAAFEKSEYSNDPLGEDYIYAYQTVK